MARSIVVREKRRERREVKLELRNEALDAHQEFEMPTQKIAPYVAASKPAQNKILRSEKQ